MLCLCAQGDILIERWREWRRPYWRNANKRGQGVRAGHGLTRRGSRTEEAVTKEARKGYVLLVIGIDRTVAVHGGFHERIARMAAGFEGPIAVPSRGGRICGNCRRSA
jgi:hypothetical protein